MSIEIKNVKWTASQPVMTSTVCVLHILHVLRHPPPPPSFSLWTTSVAENVSASAYTLGNLMAHVRTNMHDLPLLSTNEPSTVNWYHGSSYHVRIRACLQPDWARLAPTRRVFVNAQFTWKKIPGRSCPNKTETISSNSFLFANRQRWTDNMLTLYIYSLA